MTSAHLKGAVCFGWSVLWRWVILIITLGVVLVLTHQSSKTLGTGVYIVFDLVSIWLAAVWFYLRYPPMIPSKVVPTAEKKIPN